MVEAGPNIGAPAQIARLVSRLQIVLCVYSLVRESPKSYLPLPQSVHPCSPLLSLLRSPIYLLCVPLRALPYPALFVPLYLFPHTLEVPRAHFVPYMDQQDQQLQT